METDQFATLGLAMAAWLAAGVGAQVLLVPAFRYVWVLLQAALGRPVHDPKPRDGDNTAGRRLCALMMVLLLVALAPVTPAAAREAAAWLAVLVLTWSYGGDLRHVLRRRPPVTATG